MSTASVRNAISAALAAMVDRDLTVAATGLLAACGYQSERTLPDQSGNASDFIQQFPASNAGTQSEQAFLGNAESVHVLFQFTSGEIQAETQRALFDASGFDTGNARSFLFAAVQLRGDAYPRGQYVAFTRELNKRFPMPMVVLFRTAANLISLAFVHRRPNKRDPERDVLGSVSLIREINAAEPHRAHLDILAELSLSERLKWMDDHGKPRNFDGLLDAWLAALDTEELNRRFYRELFNWFETAVKTAKFGDQETATVAYEEHVIRLITRLMFVWFIKEKGLVAEDLFIENQAAELLKDYEREDGDSYYRAVLQNLFFATLNTEIGQRRFSRESRDDHRNFSVYRYRNEIADPARLVALFDQTPFINGGLFDCLDSFDATGAGGVRVDCFTDNPSHRAGYSIPNRLFFGESAKPGLIDLFNRYKFTVEENTPTEQEVALDPELLGKVFENLLAAVNPETQQTARKETGSYYTPRAVVDYMVDEALVATLAQKASPEDGDADYWQARLRFLLDYRDAFDDADTLFTSAEREAVVRAIAGIKALDPAVGSGAFPMGTLHKLTLALRRLDEHNQLWESLQKELAGQRAAATFDTQDPEERESELAEISRTFEKYRDSDFGRKLYLIQNSIYGVDIQPIATQIAKLRFFISLAIEQQPNTDPSDNYGIRPLPNLETRFVAANTLLALDSSQGVLTSQRARELQNELRQNRERYFHANNRTLKLRWQGDDQRLRGELAAELRQIGMDAGDADKIAACDLFDQNAAAANWFDAEYMFGVTDGFDVVIANPPYVRQEDIGPNKAALVKQYSDAATARSDLYCYFYARGLQLLRDGGTHVFVCSNSWLDVGYGAKLQEYLLNNAHVQAIYESALERQFATADINTIISVIRKTGNPTDSDITRFVSLRDEFDTALSDATRRREIVRTRASLKAAGLAPPDNRGRRKFVGDKWGGKYLRAPDIYHAILKGYGDKLVRLGDVATVRFGIKTGANDFFYLTPERVAEFGIEAEYCRPVMTTPQESRSIAVNPVRLPKRLFMCHDDKELVGPGALAYINWGEEQEYDTRSSTKSRLRWYDLGQRDTARLAMNYLIDTTARTFYVEDGLLFGDNLQEIRCVTVSQLQLCAALNSTLSQLMVNIGGRANFGGGLMKIQTFEIESLQIVNPQLLPEPNDTVFNAADWDVLTPSAARRHIDDAVYDALGLTAGEREAVYAGVNELVGNRRRRAGSVSGSASAAGTEPQMQQDPFKVVPLASSYAPGVNDDNLKDIINEMEDEYLLRKLGL